MEIGMSKWSPRVWYMCLNPFFEGDKPQVRHETFEEAKVEAGRLALKTGRKIHVLQLVGTMHPPHIPAPIWEQRA